MPLDYERLKGWKFPERRVSYTKRDTILYALGIGFGDKAEDAAHLRYLLEDRLIAFPTYASVLAEDSNWPLDPNLGITFSHIVHGEQSLELHAPLPTEGTLIVRGAISQIIDKGAGKGAIVSVERHAHAEMGGVLVASATSSVFCRADGGFNGPVTKGAAPHGIPETPPEAVIDLPVSVRAALIYRLSGDPNMLHADPAAAKVAGFPRPILHGMCTYAMAGRAILQQYGGGLRSLQTRFTAPVFAGETLRTEMWCSGSVVSFRMRSVERDAVVLNNGRAELA